MQDGRKAVWNIPYVYVAFFLSLKHNFIAYRSSKVSDCIFEIHQLWQLGFSRLYSNCCCSCSFEPEPGIIKIDQSSQKMYSNNILNFQESTPILNARTKNVWKLIVCTSYQRNTLGTDFTSTYFNFDWKCFEGNVIRWVNILPLCTGFFFWRSREPLPKYLKITVKYANNKYLSLPPTRQDLTQGQKPEGRLKWG